MNRYRKCIRNRIFARLGAGLLVSALIMLLLAGSAMALEDPDLSREGSVTLTVTDKTPGNPRPVTDGELELILVAQGEIQNSRYVLTPVGVFADEDFNLDLSGKTDLSGKDVADGVYDYAVARIASIPGSQRWKTELTDTGTASWTGLKLGLYLVHQTRTARDYQALNPFLVTVPLVERNASGEPAGYVYDVNASPKPGPVEHETTQEPETPTKPSTPDKPNERLPQTGQLWWPVWVLIGTGAVCIAVGLILQLYRRRMSRRESAGQ